MLTSPLIRCAAAVLLGWFLIAPAASAQDQTMRSLSIRDGQVYIDGKQIPPGDLPPSLDTDGIQVQYTFSGDVRPVIDINGDFFVIERDGLRLADASEHGRASVFLNQGQPGRARFDSGFGFVVGDEMDDDASSDFFAPHAVGVGRQARELADQAMKFHEMQSRLEESLEEKQLQELTIAAERLSKQAEQAALAAEALPMLELQNYLFGVQRRDRQLYEQLVKERELEHETIVLSNEIRSMDDGPARDEKIRDLRRMLDDAFEQKQANRRREIDQLEGRLQDLQRKLEERERLRDEIIDNRMRELLDVESEFKW